MLTLLIVISCVAVTFIYTTLNLLFKLEMLESHIESQDKFIDEQLAKATKLLENLQALDNKQMFEKDDEVGSIFTQLKETIKQHIVYKNDENG